MSESPRKTVLLKLPAFLAEPDCVELGLSLEQPRSTAIQREAAKGESERVFIFMAVGEVPRDDLVSVRLLAMRLLRIGVIHFD